MAQKKFDKQVEESAESLAFGVGRETRPCLAGPCNRSWLHGPWATGGYLGAVNEMVPVPLK